MSMGTVGRRLLSIPAVIVALPLVVVTAPLWVPLTILVDLASRLFRFPMLRLAVFALIYLIHEWLGLLAALGLGLAELFGWRRTDPVGRTAVYRRVQGWWATSLLRWAGRLLGVAFDLPDTATLPRTGFLTLSRHASMVDAVLPALVVTGGLDRFVHYVMKAELRWVPNIDVFGHRLGNYFVTRDGDGRAESEAIHRLGAGSLPDAALVIFPEGTYATPASRSRVRASLVRSGPPELVALADELSNLLPPKPAGSLALMDAQPDYDVVIFGHVGLEGVAELSGLRRRLPLVDPIVVRWWSHRRAEVPNDDEARVEWLNDQWRALDAWVASVPRPGRGSSRSSIG